MGIFHESFTLRVSYTKVLGMHVRQIKCTFYFPILGCYFAITHGSFSPNTTRWYDLLHRSSGKPDNYSICKESSFTSCEKLSILDFTMVDNRILLVTSKGLIRSESMGQASELNKTKVR